MVLIVIFLLVLTAGYFGVRFGLRGEDKTPIIGAGCLGENEYADVEIKKADEYWSNTGTLSITVKNRAQNNQTIRKFVVNDVFLTYHPYEIRRCGVYVIRVFNFDSKHNKFLEGYSVELWKYDYFGKEENLIVLSDNDYDFDFRVDLIEEYIALVRGYMGSENYSLIIKKLSSNEDEFVLPRQLLFEKYPNFFGGFGLYQGWTKNDSAFWANLFSGAHVEAFVRILRDTWLYDVLPAPEKTQGGDALNMERGLVTYNTGPGWIGIHELAQEIYNEWRTEGKIVELHVYNLFTKDDIIVATSSDPSWWGKPRWRNENELEYELSDGVQKVYTVR